MKKQVVVVLMIIVCVIAAGCSDQKKENQPITPAVTKVTQLSTSSFSKQEQSEEMDFINGVTEEATSDEKEAVINEVLSDEKSETEEQIIVPMELESQIKRLEEIKTTSKINWEIEKAKDAEVSASYILQDLLSTSKSPEGFVKSAWMGQIESIERKAQMIRSSQDKIKGLNEQTAAALDAQSEELNLTQQEYEIWVAELEKLGQDNQEFQSRAERAFDHAASVIEEAKLQVQEADKNLQESLEKVESYLEEAKAVLTAV